jgi:energy-coupling factor transporter ATP-binding protein EcfA2
MTCKKICLFAPTGSGKSTIAKCIAQEYNAKIIKIAEPLYHFQDYFYEMINKEIEGQDGELLQFLGQKIESEKPGWLGKTFIDKVKKCSNKLIINDDCRFNSYEILKDFGFIFIKIVTEKEIREERLRSDHVEINPNHPVEAGFDYFEENYCIYNNGLLEETMIEIRKIINSLHDE